MDWFVTKHSIVRKIWGNPDTILFIFAGAAAEFAVNKAVDWLFFTGRLPADPLGRLFSTVNYARLIVFSQTDVANKVIDKMSSIHHQVEQSRGYEIPQWAYRDVLYMLIDYSIRSQELLVNPLTEAEKEEVYDVFRRVGIRMKIAALPGSYSEWLNDRVEHLQNDLEYSQYSADLYRQYRFHLGSIRYRILRSAQGVVVPERVGTMLNLSNSQTIHLLVRFYKILVFLNLDWFLKMLILPRKYIRQVKELETFHS